MKLRKVSRCEQIAKEILFHTVTHNYSQHRPNILPIQYSEGEISLVRASVTRWRLGTVKRRNYRNILDAYLFSSLNGVMRARVVVVVVVAVPNSFCYPLERRRTVRRGTVQAGNECLLARG